jgi:hypothetical protein
MEEEYSLKGNLDILQRQDMRVETRFYHIAGISIEMDDAVILQKGGDRRHGREIVGKSSKATQ